jgi:hypothetical protein
MSLSRGWGKFGVKKRDWLGNGEAVVIRQKELSNPVLCMTSMALGSCYRKHDWVWGRNLQLFYRSWDEIQD